MEADDATRNPEIFLQTLDRKPDGFETTDCLECLQILNILIYGRRVYFKAGDWILCTMIGYRIPERETCCILPVNQLSHTYLFTKWKKCNILSLFHQKYYAKKQKNDFPVYGKSFFVSLVFSCKAGGFAQFRAAVYKRSLSLFIRILP